MRDDALAARFDPCVFPKAQRIASLLLSALALLALAGALFDTVTRA